MFCIIAHIYLSFMKFMEKLNILGIFGNVQISDKAGFGRSLFERLVLLGHKKHLLNVQYRMHPSISLFPNMEFYDKQILDSPSVKERSYEKHFLHGDMFKSYSFINVAFGFLVFKRD